VTSRITITGIHTRRAIPTSHNILLSPLLSASTGSGVGSGDVAKKVDEMGGLVVDVEFAVGDSSHVDLCDCPFNSAVTNWPGGKAGAGGRKNTRECTPWSHQFRIRTMGPCLRSSILAKAMTLRANVIFHRAKRAGLLNKYVQLAPAKKTSTHGSSPGVADV
jgi:hypothetical protein